MYSALRPLSEDYLENAQRVRYFCYNHDINFSKVLLWPAACGCSKPARPRLFYVANHSQHFVEGSRCVADLTPHLRPTLSGYLKNFGGVNLFSCMCFRAWRQALRFFIRDNLPQHQQDTMLVMAPGGLVWFLGVSLVSA